jgi:hypothetical protein
MSKPPATGDLFRLQIDGHLIGEGLTVAQVIWGVGDVAAQFTAIAGRLFPTYFLL